jgi:hypothetical protein
VGIGGFKGNPNAAGKWDAYGAVPGLEGRGHAAMARGLWKLPLVRRRFDGPLPVAGKERLGRVLQKVGLSMG